jgi:hypothetical protein
VNRSLIVVLLPLMFLSMFSALTPHVGAIVDVPYDNIGVNWTRNPNLIPSDDAWNARVWQWSTNSLELSHGDANNYVTWSGAGTVVSQAKDSLGGSYMASNFDQGYEKYENEISDFNGWGWNNKACSLRIEGSITVFDGVGFAGESRTFISDIADLGGYNWNSKISSLKLSSGSRVTLYSSSNYSGESLSFTAPSYQPPPLKIADTKSITMESVVSNWYTDTWTSPGWTGVKFDIFAVENQNGGTGTSLMLEMYILRDGLNLAWSYYSTLGAGCSGNQNEGFRGPPYQSAYNYLVALDAFPEIARMTNYPGNVAKWTIDVRALLQRAGDHGWGVSPNYFHLDINSLSIAKVSFTVESANLLMPANVGATLNRLRLAYTSNSVVSDLNAIALQATANQAYFVFGDPHRMTSSLATYDVAAGSTVYGMCMNPQIPCFDSDPTVASQNVADKGRLLLNAKAALMFGGPNPNLAVHYLEQHKQTPLYFEASTGSEGTRLKFVETATGTAKVNVLASSYSNEHEDYFILESLIDANSNHIFISYGFDWKGTWAAGLYLKANYNAIQSYSNVYYIFHWVDTNGNGIPEPNEITQTATG